MGGEGPKWRQAVTCLKLRLGECILYIFTVLVGLWPSIASAALYYIHSLFCALKEKVGVAIGQYCLWVELYLCLLVLHVAAADIASETIGRAKILLEINLADTCVVG